MHGHAIEVRINAEDPAKNFMPAPGTVSALRIPGGPGTRFDTMLYQGYQVPPFYDSLLGKLIVWDETREAAIARMAARWTNSRSKGFRRPSRCINCWRRTRASARLISIRAGSSHGSRPTPTNLLPKGRMALR
jgi:acetyl/propionyl-CoA carboxylase alpha subunit